MAKARLYFDGDNTYIEKQARIYKMVDEIGDKIDNIPGVINNLSSTSETDALSAAMGKELQDQINAMSGNFHFLSSWDCTTGLPGSDPATDPYVYQSGDYYIVSNTGSTNYKPHGSSYTHGVASTAVETQPVQMNDWYVYDGSTWILQPSGGAQIVIDTALSTTSTNPVENRVITQALNNKQNTIANLSTIEAGAALGATSLQPGANITQLTNNAGYQTAGDVASAIAGKQDVLTEGDGIDITNNVISCTVEYTGGTDIEVTSNNVINFTNTSGYMLKSSNKLIYATTDTAFNTRDKICTTADGNYTPREGDVLALTFNSGCGVGSPRLDIDGSGLHSISISTTGANAATFWLGMDKISWLFVYDGSRWITWPIKDTVYSAGTGLSLSSGTFSNTQPGPTIGTTAPATPTEGAMWYDTTNHVLKVYNGTEWTEVGSGGGGGSTTWGNIGGVLSNQTDLADALDTKLESTDLVAGDGINIQAVGSALPSGYTQLQSISSSGSQYILTGINYASGHTYEFTHRLFVDSSTEASKGSGWNAGGGIMMIDQSGVKYSGGGTSSVIGAAGQELELTISVGSGTSTYNYKLGGTTGSLTRSNTSLSSYAGNVSYPLFVSTVNNQGGTIFVSSELVATYYYFEAKDNDVLVRKMYPAKRDADNAIGMYDVVNNVFYTNSGSGTFIPGAAVPVEGIEISVDDTVWTDDNVEAGTGISIDTGTSARLPSGYTEVEYIQSDGNSYIDTGVVTNGTDYIENHFQKLGSSTTTCAWFGSWETNSLIRFCIGSYSSQLIGPCFFGGYNYTSPIGTLNTDKNVIKFYYAGGTYYQTLNDGVPSTYSPQNEGTNPSITSYLFARHGASGQSDTYDNEGTKVFYHLQKDNNGIKKMELIPCTRDSDDEPGFYDLVNERFLANGGSGTLTAGPAVTFNPTKIISVDPSTLPTYTAGTGIDITSGVISSTVLGFNNLTYDSFTTGTWTANATIPFPATAKMAFLNWRAKSTVSGNPPFACGQVLIVRGLTLVSSFIGGGNGTDYIYGGVGLDSASTYIDYTQAGKTSGAAGIDYTIYFYK